MNFSEYKKILPLSMGLILSLASGCFSPLAFAAGELSPSKDSKATVSGADMLDKKDPYGRDNPRGAVQGFMHALTSNDESLAMRYLDTTNNKSPSQTVRELKQALDNSGRISPDMQLSSDPTGNLSDKLPANIDKIGVIGDKSGDVDILLERVKDKDGDDIWLFSQQTLKKLPSLTAQDTPSWVETYIPKTWLTYEFEGINTGHIIAVIALILVSFGLSYLASWLFYGFYSLCYRLIYKDREKPLDTRVVLPLAVVATAVAVKELMVMAGVSVVVREMANRGADILGWFASAWLLLRIIDVLFRRASHLTINSSRPERLSILNLLRKVAKVVITIFALIVILGNLGFDLTTGIAALGVGGLALALGAQKTVENLVGSVVVVADKPVSVGDYCRFDKYEGIVEDIGIRSTRVRTPNRTVLTIPNGEFSSMKIENFTSRDMFQFLHSFYIARNAKTQALRDLIDKLEQYILHYPKTNNHLNQVRIAQMQQDAYTLEVRCHVVAISAIEFNEIQTDMILDIMAIIEKSELEFSLPTQQIIIEKKSNASDNMPQNPQAKSETTVLSESKFDAKKANVGKIENPEIHIVGEENGENGR